MKFKLTNTAMKNIDNRSNSELIKVPSRQFPPSGWRSSNRFEPASQLTGIPVDFEQCVVSGGQKRRKGRRKLF
jgi:hypothetical protein